LRLREVEQACRGTEICSVTCETDEVAINARCPRPTAAMLISVREVSCGRANREPMVAFCVKK
jgi:hypothetical protein